MRRTAKPLGAACLAALCAAPAIAGADPPALVPYTVVDGREIPAPLAGPGDPGRGREILLDPARGDCLACHSLAALPDAPEQGTVAGPLDDAAARLGAGALRLWIVEPRILDANALMPGYYRIQSHARGADGDLGATLLTAQEIEDVVAYLTSLKK